MTHNLGRGKYKHRVLERGPLSTRLNRKEVKAKTQSYVLDLETIRFIHEDAHRSNLNLSAYIRRLVRQAHEKLEVCDGNDGHGLV